MLATYSEIQAVQEYSAKIIAGEINAPVALTAAQSWLRGPFAWPPTYDYSWSTCPIVIVMMDSAIQIFSITTLYFKNFDKVPPEPPKSLRANLPQWWFPQMESVNQSNSNATTTTTTVIKYKYKSWVATIYYEFLSLLRV